MATVLLDALRADAPWVAVAEARLAELTGVAARVRTGDNGRPGFDRDGVDVGTTTTAGVRLVGVAVGCRIGVDAERADRRLRNPERFTRKALTDAERAVVARLGDDEARRRALLRLWTGKEAVLKLTGDGIGVAPEALSCAALLTAAPGTWAPVDFDAVAHGVVALRPGGAVLLTLAADVPRALVRLTPAAREAIRTVTP